MKKLIVILLTGMFLISNISNISAMCGKCGHKKHEHSDKAVTTQKTDKAHKKHNCPHKKEKKCKKMCPEHMKGVTKTTKNIDNGIEITMTAKKDKTVSKLREIAKEHYNAKESICENCPCKVEGAVVQTEDIEKGVKVLITADDPEAVKKIQELAAKKHEHKKHKKGCPKHKKKNS